ncbi:MAG: hypothetical protein M5U26_01305 [Planctomycetota bacterium]|nr:hypothetical protein [Planctomycetota bacterium]
MHVLSNRRLRAAFDPATGNLLELGAPSGPSLLKALFCRVVEDGAARRDGATGEERPFEIERVKLGRASVESVARTGKLRIERRFELPKQGPLLRCRIRVTALKGGAWERPALPAASFGPRFLDTYTDERDLYFDGAELPGGREVPGWRVFFEQGHATGLLLATRSRERLSHLVILGDGFEFRPHVPAAYSTEYRMVHSPLRLKKGQALETAFELGPWSKRAHARLLREAKLEAPARVATAGVKPPSGRATKPKRRAAAGLTFDLVALARAQRKTSSGFRRDRWLVAPAPWDQGSKVLFANGGVHPPAVRAGVGLRGLYRVYAGIGNSEGVALRANGSLTLRHRQDYIGACAPQPWSSRLESRHAPYELHCDVVRLDGRGLEVGAFPNRQMPAMLTTLRLEPLETAEAGRKARGAGAAPKTLMTGFADAPDIAWFTDALKPDPEIYRAVIREHARCGFRRVCWRIDGQCSDYPSKLNTMRYVSARVHGLYSPPAKAYGRLLKKVDLLKLAVETAREEGLELYGWMRFNFYGGNVQSDFFRQHKEYWEEAENGYRGTKLCLALPEVREHKLGILLEAAGYGLDGLSLGFLRHAPILHYHPALVEGFKREYGTLPPRPQGLADPAYHQSLPPDDAEHRRWFAYRARFMTEFGRDLRKRLRAAGRGGTKISIWVRPNHTLFDGIDLEAWLDEDLCDEVVADVMSPRDAEHPANEPRPEWIARVRAKKPLLRGVWYQNAAHAARLAPRIAAGPYDGLSVYESNHAVVDDKFREIFHGLRSNGTAAR